MKRIVLPIALIVFGLFLFVSIFYFTSQTAPTVHDIAARIKPSVPAEIEAKGQSTEPENGIRPVEPIPMSIDDSARPKAERALLGEAREVEMRVDGIVQGRQVRLRVLEIGPPNKFKYVRTEETLAAARADGVRPVLQRTSYVADQVIVRLKPGAARDELERINAKFGATIQRTLLAPDTYLVRLQDHSTSAVEVAVAQYKEEARSVAHAEPNYIIYAIETIPNDSSFSQLWGLKNVGQTGGGAGADIDATLAWDLTTGSNSVLVGVIDTGISLTHNDLVSNLWINPGEIAGNGVDDDGNGFVDDVNGWDFYYDDNNPNDGHYHGTHCAGTIGGAGNNGQGVVGVCWNVKLAAIKFLSDGGSGVTSDAVDCVYYSNTIGCDLTSNSWGGGGFSQTLQDAIAAAGAQERLFVAAAGNNSGNNDSFPHYPSNYPLANIISVAATDHNDAIASFSNYGLTSVDLAGPGVNIYSCYPGNSYQSLSGTSMATPHVSGVCALVKSLLPSASAAEVKEAVLSSVDPVPSMAGKCVTGGRLNAYKAVLPFAGPVLQLENNSISDSNGNNDGIVNPGETISIATTLKNAGIEHAIGVTGTLVSSDANPWITITQGSSDFGTILSGTTLTGPISFEILIAADAPTPQIAYFFLQLSDSEGGAWNLDFSVSLYSTSQISGFVRLDGNAVNGATIDYSGPQEGSVATDINGYYSIVCIDGTYTLTAKQADWKDSAPVVLDLPPAAATHDFDFTTTTISGTITDVGTGDPLELALISFTGDHTDTVTTDVDGMYSVTLVTDRELAISVSASKPGFVLSAPQDVMVPPDAIADFALGFSTIVLDPGFMILNVDEGKSITAPLTLGNQGSADLDFSVVTGSSNVQTTGLWHTTTHRVYNEPTSFYYGLENVWNYSTGSTNSGELRFSGVQIPAQASLTFWQWRQTEGGTTYDKSLVQVSTNNGVSWTTLYQSTLYSTTAWAQAVVSLASFAGQTVQLRFFFDTVDSGGNGYEGWYVSDLRLNGQGLGSWLSVTPSSGTVAPATQTNLSITANAMNLLPGQHVRSITVNSNDPSTPTLEVPVTLNVQSVPILAAQGQAWIEEGSSDGDGFLEPGERIGLIVSLRNTGHLSATGLQGVLTSSSSQVSLVENEATFATIAPGTAENSTQLLFDVAPGTANGTTVSFTFNVTDSVARTWSFSFSTTILIRYRLTGTVSDAGTLQGLSGASVFVNGATTTTASNGTYTLNGIMPGSYSVQASKNYFLSSSRSVNFTSDRVENFALGRAKIDLTPASITQTVRHHRSADRTLNISNSGSLPLNWTVSQPSMQYIKTDSDSAGGPVYNWSDISSTGTAITGLGDDNNIGPYNIGFSFPFYGQNFSSFRVCSNGYISFTSSSTQLSGYQLPNGSAPENLIAWYWMDLLHTTGASTHYKLVDANTLVIQFKDIAHYSNSSLRVSAQIVLSSNGTILIQYARADSPASCSIGIQNSTRSSGVNIAYLQNYAKPNLAVRVAPAVDWLQVLNAAGTTQPSLSSDVTVRMNGAILAPGTYTKNLTVSSNDLERPSILVPVTFTVLPNELPVAGYTDVQTLEDTTVAIVLPGSDGDDDPLTSHFALPPRHGTLVGSGLDYVYIPDSGFNGSDSFGYILNDGVNDSSPGFVTITILPVNDPPVNTALPGVTGTLHPGRVMTATNGNWHDNLDIVPGDLTYSCQWVRASDANGGNSELIANATATTYLLTPDDLGKYVGVRVTATDNNEGLPITQSASVVSAFGLVENATPEIAEAPVKLLNIAEDAVADFVLHGSDPDGDALMWTILTPPLHGQLSFAVVNNEFRAQYKPDANYHGSDKAEVQLSDGLTSLVTLPIEISVATVNDTPTVLSALTVNPNPALSNAIVTFSTVATDVEDTVTYTWRFSDGISDSTNQGNYSRVFTVPGTYLVTVVAQDSNGLKVEQSVLVNVVAPAVPESDVDGDGVPDSIDSDDDGDGFSDAFETIMGTNLKSANSTPMNGMPASAAGALAVQKLNVILNFTKTSGDQIILTGALPIEAGFVISGATIGLDIGGVMRILRLDEKGIASSNRDSFKLQIHRKNGVVAGQNAKFSMKLTGEFAQLLADEGLNDRDANKAPVAIQVMLGMNQKFYTKLQPQLYSAKTGKRGLTR